jgi:hypothetical protein
MWVALGLVAALSAAEKATECSAGAPPLEKGLKVLQRLGEDIGKKPPPETGVNATPQPWQKVAVVFVAYKKCDDGYFAEGLSASVCWLLAKRWDRTAELLPLWKKTTGFKAFLLAHLDSTTDRALLQAIVKQAEASCPGGAAALCAEIKTHAQTALHRLSP